MRIDEVINEREFGVADQLGRGAKNMLNKAAGTFSKKAATRAIRGEVQGKAMQGANNISKKFNQWLVQKFPNQDPEILNIEVFKQWMGTSAKLKGQTTNFEFMSGEPQIQNLMKQSSPDNPVNLDGENRQKIFLNLAYFGMQGTPGAGNQNQGQSIPAGTVQPERQQKINQAVDAINDPSELAALVNAASIKYNQVKK